MRFASILLCATLASSGAQAQTIYENKDSFQGTTHFFTKQRSAHLEGGSFMSMRYVNFSFHLFSPSGNNIDPYVLLVSTTTPNWIFIEAGQSLILKLDGTEMLPLSGDGSAQSRTIGSSDRLEEEAVYHLTTEQLGRIAQAKKLEFRIIGQNSVITGSWGRDALADAAAFSSRGQSLTVTHP